MLLSPETIKLWKALKEGITNGGEGWKYYCDPYLETGGFVSIRKEERPEIFITDTIESADAQFIAASPAIATALFEAMAEIDRLKTENACLIEKAAMFEGRCIGYEKLLLQLQKQQ